MRVVRRRPILIRVRHCGVLFVPLSSILRTVRVLPRMWLAEAEGRDGWTETMSDNRLDLLNYLEEMTEAVARRHTVDTAQNPRADCDLRSARFICLLWIVRCIR